MKRDIRKIAAALLAGAMAIVPVTVMAESMPKTDAAIEITEEAKKEESRFIANEATVVEVTTSETATEALVKVGEVSYRLNLPKDLFVINQGESKIGSIADIVKDGKICYYTTAMTPVGMSDPAFLTPEFVIANTGTKSHKVSKFNETFVNAENDLKLNMDENTPIIPENGTKIKLMPDSIIGKDVVVIYSIATASIPAQTNPELVVLLNDAEEVVVPEEEVKIDIPTYKNQYGMTMVGFAATAMDLGYEVVWDDANKVATATMEKDVVKVSFKQGTVNINGKDLKIAYPMETKDGRLFLVEEAYANMFPEIAKIQAAVEILEATPVATAETVPATKLVPATKVN